MNVVVQRAAVIASCLGLWALATKPSVTRGLESMMLATLVLLACVEKLCSVMNLVAVERDWVRFETFNYLRRSLPGV